MSARRSLLSPPGSGGRSQPSRQFDSTGSYPAATPAMQTSREPASFLDQLRAALEDDEVAQWVAAALQPHLSASTKRLKGRPSLVRAGEDCEEMAGVVAAAKLQVADHLDKCSVRC